jgi:hypothetical protein
MKNVQRIVIIIFALLISSSQIFSQDTFNLNYKFEKGKTYFYRSTLSMDMSLNAMGQEMNGKTESKSKLKMEIADVTPAAIEIISSLDSMYSKTTGFQGDQENNGENFVGKKTKMIYNTQGKKIKTIEIDAITGANGMSASGGTSLLMEIADRPVKIGEVWKMATIDTNTAGGTGKIISKSDSEYKAEGKENRNGIDCLKISFKASIKTEGNMNQMGMDMVMEGTGKSTGTIYFDLTKGVIYEVSSDANMDITMAIPAQNMTMPMVQKMKSVSILLEK